MGCNTPFTSLPSSARLLRARPPGESPYRPPRGRDPRPQRRGPRGPPQHLLSFLKSEAMLRAYWLSEDGRANLGRFVERSVVVTYRLTRSLFTVSGNSPAAKARAAPKAHLRNALTAGRRYQDVRVCDRRSLPPTR